MGVLIITHYQRILHLVEPDRVSILFDGRIVKEGGPELVDAARGARATAGSSEEVGAAPPPDGAAPPPTPLVGRTSSRSCARDGRSSTSTPPRRRRSRASCSTRWSDYYCAPQRERPPRHLPARGRGDRAARGRARDASPRCARLRRRAETIFTQERDRGDQPRRLRLGPAQRRRRATRSSLTELEHHSNIVPWQMLCQEAGAHAALPARSTTRARSTLDQLDALPRRRPRASSSPSPTSRTCSGTINPVAEIVAPRPRRRRGRRSSTARRPCRRCPSTSRAIGADFYAWTGHKAYGPTGVGVLHGRRELLEAMPPFLGGGRHDHAPSTSTSSTLGELPAKFEAGTSPIAEAVGLGAAVDFLDGARHGRACARTSASSRPTRSSASPRCPG